MTSSAMERSVGGTVKPSVFEIEGPPIDEDAFLVGDSAGRRLRVGLRSAESPAAKPIHAGNDCQGCAFEAAHCGRRLEVTAR